MASIGCPFCTKTGIAMVITGLALVLLSVTIAIPWLAIIGLVFLIAAYIVPGFVSGRSCHGEGCTNPSHNHGEEDSQ
ncbi:MAG: hypothetical protein ACFFBR_04120 [Promethearchaeota archaeon]